jgi:carboxymethylenebutenolidase
MTSFFRSLAVVLGALVLLVGGYFLWYAQRPPQTTPPTQTNAEMLTPQDGQPIKAEDVAYYPDRQGYYVEPAASGTYPGIVMIHEWWGLNDQIKETARQLAGQGYRVLAVDLYGEVATTSTRARELSQNVNQEEALKNLQGASAFLRDRGSAKVASLGWCFGGGKSLQFALSGEPLDATIIYYGQLVTDQEQLRAIKQPVLGIFGEKDASIPTSTVRTFDQTLDALKIENDIRIYPNVGHAFANPSGMNYAPEATKDAWDRTLRFLEEHLK